MTFLIMAFFLFLVLVIVLGGLKSESLKSSKTSSASFPQYRPVSFSSAAETEFFFALDSFVAGRARILSKVRLADLAQPVASRRSFWQTSFNRISSKHVDFVICDHSLVPLCVLELDDSSHYLPERRRRDVFVDQVLEDIGLPIFHFPVRSSYFMVDFKVLDKFLLK